MCNLRRGLAHDCVFRVCAYPRLGLWCGIFEPSVFATWSCLPSFSRCASYRFCSRALVDWCRYTRCRQRLSADRIASVRQASAVCRNGGAAPWSDRVCRRCVSTLIASRRPFASFSMPLIKCPACDKDISAEARACPHCGHPLLTRVGTKKSRKGGWLILAIVIADQQIFRGRAA